VLGGAAGITLVRPTAAADGLQIVVKPGRVEVWLDDSVWIVDEAAFAPGCHVAVREQDAGYALTLQGGRLPGTAFDASLTATILPGSEGWRLRLRFPALNLTMDTGLARWLTAPASVGTLRADRAVGFGSVALPRAPAAVQFGHQWRWRFAYAEPRVAETPPGPLTIDLAELSLGTAGIPGVLLQLSCTVMPPAPVPLGQTASGATLVLQPTALACEARYAPQAAPDIAWLGRGTLAVYGADGAGQMEGLRALAVTIRTTVAARQVAAVLDTGPHVMVLGGHSLVVSGTGEVGLAAVGGRLAPFALHLLLHSVHTPVLDADFARFDLVRTALVITADPAPDRATTDAHGWLGGLTRVPLHDAWLTVRRGADLLNLRFAFKNMRLVLSSGAASLQRESGTCPALMQVTFPPQHLVEQVYPCAGDGSPAAIVTDDKSCGPFDQIAQSRLSGETRLVFEIPDSPDPDPAAEAVPLSVDGLTCWAGLNLVVTARALPANATLEDQFAAAGLDRTSRIEDLMDGIRHSIAAPGRWETAVELPYRLTLSPSCRARWTTPPPLAAGPAHELWSARLNAVGAGDVRAVWSPDWAPTVLSGGPAPDDDGLPPWTGAKPILMALGRNDRYQLVGLTALYGLPALLRRPPLAGSGAGEDAAANGPGTLKASVVPMPDGWGMALNPDQGFYVARAADSGQMRLTSLGGTLDLDGGWEPPAPYTTNAFPAFKVERVSYQATLGRDLYVRVLKKGFLFPLGNRCSFVKVMERRFGRRAGDAQGEPTAYLIQRQFIVIGAPQKTFPAMGQPYNGRAMPARRINMITRQTPDLLPPLFLPPQSSGQAFWPTTPNGRVKFEFDLVRSDGSAARATGPLMFVDNAYAHDPSAMASLVALYQNQSDRDFAINGALEYVPPTADETGQHPTTTLNLTAHGRVAAVSGTELTAPPLAAQFFWDAGLEGADQPPFYPALAEADLTIESIERLASGRGGTSARYDGLYLLHGIDPQGNPSGICLRITKPDLVLDVSKDSRATVGLATSNLQVGAWSPTKGLIGGAAAPGQLPMTAAAESGHFDPGEFLGSLLQSRLMGLLQLRDLLGILPIDGAPQLLQSIDYGLEQGIAPILTAIGTALGAVLAADPNKARAVLYPGLSTALDRLQAAVQVLQAQDPMAALVGLGALAIVMRAVLHELNVIHQDPTPPLLNDFVPAIQAVLGGVAQDALQGLRDSLLGVTTTWLGDPADPAAQPFRDLLGLAAVQVINGGRVDDALVAQTAGRAAETIFEDGLAPHLRAAAAAAPLVADTGQVIARLDAIIAQADAIAARSAGVAVDQAADGLQALATSVRAGAILVAPALPASAAALTTLAGNLDAARAGVLSLRARDQTLDPDRVGFDVATAIRQVPGQVTLVRDAVRSDAAAWAARPFDTLARVLLAVVDTAGGLQRLQAVATAAASGKIPDSVRAMTLAAFTDADRLNKVRVSWLDAVQNNEESFKTADAAVLTSATVVRTRTQELAPALDGLIAACAALRTAGTREADWIPACSRVYAARLEMLDRVAALASAVAVLEDRSVSVSQYLVPKLRDLLDSALSPLPSAQEMEPFATLLQAAVDLPALAAVAPDFANLRTEQQAWHMQAQKLGTPVQVSNAADLQTAVTQAIALVTTERRLAGLMTEPLLAFAASLTPAMGVLLRPVQKIAQPVLAIEIAVLGLANALQTQIGRNPIAAALLNPSILVAYHDAVNRLALSVKQLNKISNTPDPATALPLLVAEAADWASTVPPPLGPARVLAQVASSLLAGHFSTVFDTTVLEAALLQAVAKLIPTQASYNYDWTADLQPFPSGMPVFEPMTDRDRPGRLTLSSTATVSLSGPRMASFSASGSLESFRLNLIGPIQALIIEVNAIRFTSSDHSGPSMKVELGQIIIGPALDFLSALSDWLFGGRGPYVAMQANPLGVLAGYSFSLPSITCGELTLTSIALDIAVELPFESQPATFRFGLASRDRPFLLIVAPCFGGGGFVSFKAVANRIVGFEASFMFGAVVGLSFGPLEASGWVAAGIYIAKDEVSGAAITGFVQAAGEGQIACFAISCMLEVTVSQISTPEGSRMEGSAHYEFHFKAGFIEVGYGFTATYSYRGSQRSSGTTVSANEDLLLPRTDLPVRLAAFRTRLPPDPNQRHLHFDVHDRSTDWAAYHSYFDLGAEG
jgi:hypothetical protein